MQRNTTFNLPEKLIAGAKEYAAKQGTTVTALIRDYLETITTYSEAEPEVEPLQAYSKGLLSRADAIRLLGLRDHSELLVALGEADLPMPTPPAHEVEQQARLFEQIWKNT